MDVLRLAMLTSFSSGPERNSQLNVVAWTPETNSKGSKRRTISKWRG